MFDLKSSKVPKSGVKKAGKSMSELDHRTMHQNKRSFNNTVIMPFPARKKFIVSNSKS